MMLCHKFYFTLLYFTFTQPSSQQTEQIPPVTEQNDVISNNITSVINETTANDLKTNTEDKEIKTPINEVYDRSIPASAATNHPVNLFQQERKGNSLLHKTIISAAGRIHQL